MCHQLFQQGVGFRNGSGEVQIYDTMISSNQWRLETVSLNFYIPPFALLSFLPSFFLLSLFPQDLNHMILT